MANGEREISLLLEKVHARLTVVVDGADLVSLSDQHRSIIKTAITDLDAAMGLISALRAAVHASISIL